MIGGKTFADGPFLIDDAEDSNFVSETLGRNWIPDYNGGNPILSHIDLMGAGLGLADGQTTGGAFKAEPKRSFGFINQGFGIPMPGEVGQSTLDFPGDITSFPNLNFFMAHQANSLTNLQFQLLLECYPENGSGGFPTVFWNYTAPEGTQFNPVSIELGTPTGVIDNENSLSVETLLSQTRFLFFFFSAAEDGPGATWTIYMDDITLGGQEEGERSLSVSNWELYDTETRDVGNQKGE